MGSISTHDFLLAAMVICLNLSQQISEDDRLRLIGTALWCPRRQAMADTLEKSYQIWKYGSAASRFGARLGSGHAAFEGTRSSDTNMASKALGVMLDRVRKHFGGRVDGGGVCGALPSPAQTTEPNEITKLPFLGVVSHVPWTNDAPNQTDQRNTVPVTNSTLRSQEPSRADMLEPSQTFDQDMPNVDFSAIGDMIDGPVDWGMWDDHIMQQHVQQAGSWNENTNLPPGGPPNPDILAQWAGAQYVQPPQPGNNFDMNGAAAGTQDVHSNMMFDWQDLEDVDLDIRDYGTGGFWGKSPPG